MEKGMTVRELIDKLEWSIENGYIKDHDKIFYSLPGEDGGDLEALRPVVNIANPTIVVGLIKDESVDEMLQREPITLCFIRQIKR